MRLEYMNSAFSVRYLNIMIIMIKIILSLSKTVEFPVTFNNYKLFDNETKPLTITASFPFCIGTPSKCFNFMIDTMTSTSWLADEAQKEYFNNTFIRSQSNSNEESNLSFSMLFSGCYCTGIYVKEIVSPLSEINHSHEGEKMHIGLLNASEISNKIITRDGTLGMMKSYYYNTKAGTTYNYLDYLKNNSLIESRIISFDYNDLKKGKLIFGSLSNPLKETCGKDITTYKNTWICFINFFTFGKEKIETPNEMVMFDSIHQNIVAPYEGGFFILNKMQKQSKDHCKIETEKSETIFYLFCDNQVDSSIFENIKFQLGDHKFVVYIKDLFTDLPSGIGYIVQLKVNKNEKLMWTFGLPAFKHKIISLNQDELIISWKDLHPTGKKLWLFCIISVIILILIVSILFYLRRKHHMNNPQGIDFTLI